LAITAFSPDRTIIKKSTPLLYYKFGENLFKYNTLSIKEA